MPVVLVHQGPTVTSKGYEETVRKLTGGKKTRMESPEDWPVQGLLAHIAGDTGSGFRVVDVWESEQACREFGDRLGPILQEVGITDQPEIYPAHAFVTS